MKPSSSNSRSKGHAKARRKTREELDQEARDRKRQKKRRGHAPGSRAAGGNTTSGSKGQNAPKDPRIGSKTPIPLGVTEKVTKQHKPKSEKPMLSPQAELELLETDERLDALLERLEAGETLKLDTGCLVAMSATVDYDVALQNDIKNGFLGGEGLFLATLTGPGEVWLQSLPFSRMADEIIKASKSNKGENKGGNNPISEVTGGLDSALGGLFKF